MTTERPEEIRQFLRDAGWQDAAVRPLPGDASTRRYFQVERGRQRAILMDQPQNAEAPPCPPGASSDMRRMLGYNAVARLAGADCARFVAIAKYLRGRNLHTPEIHFADTGAGLVLMEDLGDSVFDRAITAGADETALYKSAIEALAHLHLEPAPESLGKNLPLYAYDETAQLAETHLLIEWYLPLVLGRGPSAAEIAEHESLWRGVLRSVESSAPVFVHRDYHAQNLIWIPQKAGVLRTGIIDFQDALAGAPAYDIVSLLEDARRYVSSALKNSMVEHYGATMRAHGRAVDTGQLSVAMAVTAAQRNAKIAGIFARLHLRDRKPRYLGYLPRVWRYLESDLEHPALAPLRAWYDRILPPDTRRACHHSQGAAA